MTYSELMFVVIPKAVDSATPAIMAATLVFYLVSHFFKKKVPTSLLLTLFLTLVSYSFSAYSFNWDFFGNTINTYLLIVIYDMQLILLLWALHRFLKLQASNAYIYILVFSAINCICSSVMYIDLAWLGRAEVWWLWHVYAIVGKFIYLGIMIGLCTNKDFLNLRALWVKIVIRLNERKELKREEGAQ
ncbi:hypothetical protein HG263_19540 [Pseudoalteromonas sp. JBTF-M23]|uniref:Uncharacterized protein n=1 Tax=Pseudoalteromonas caenipelagi TaxID=2726988 RepID=A0A849VJS2_9GAMM|nr:hypothetical protein [Pseudoalteromonas caenipelagi]NOU52703.1 hypothetical protein [Pseudoalteromonas caenipelagi]